MAEGVKSSHDGPHAGDRPQVSRVTGGLIITCIAVVLVLGSFAICDPKTMFTIGSVGLSSTAVPRILAFLVAAAGVGVMAGFIPVRGAQDFYGGLALILLAVLALVASAELPGQRGFAFGPGTAPRLFALILAGMGIAVALVGMTSRGPEVEKYRFTGPALVILGIFLFAALIRPFGLVAATYAAFMISIMGSSEMRWIESVIAAAVMTLFCVVLFVNLLNLPFQLWPQPNGHLVLLKQFEDVIAQMWIIAQKLTVKAC